MIIPIVMIAKAEATRIKGLTEIYSKLGPMLPLFILLLGLLGALENNGWPNLTITVPCRHPWHADGPVRTSEPAGSG